jgi:hypothetical protein
VTRGYPLSNRGPHAHDLRKDPTPYVLPPSWALQPRTEVWVEVEVDVDEAEECALAATQRPTLVVLAEFTVERVQFVLEHRYLLGLRLLFSELLLMIYCCWWVHWIE